MNYVKMGFGWIGKQILRFGQWLRSFEPDDTIGFCVAVLVLLAITFGVAKIWCIAISDVGYYDNVQGTPSFMIMRSNTVGYTICWTEEGSADFKGCVATRKR
jgi:hypothetical protein